MNQDPQWLRFLSRKLHWFAIPQLAMILVAAQIFGFLLIHQDPSWLERLALIPESVLQGEFWRVLTFLAVPWTTSLIGMIFVAMFSYFVLNMIEAEWGASKTTLYVAIGILMSVIFSLLFRFPIVNSYGLGSTFFLAAATLFPRYQINLYMVLPVQMKHLAWLAIAFTLFRFFQESWLGKLYLIVLFTNYFLFFTPALIYQVKQWKRRRDFQSKL